MRISHLKKKKSLNMTSLLTQCGKNLYWILCAAVSTPAARTHENAVDSKTVHVPEAVTFKTSRNVFVGGLIFLLDKY